MHAPVAVFFLAIATALASDLTQPPSPGSRTLRHAWSPEKLGNVIHATATQHTQVYRDIPKGGVSGTTVGLYHDQHGGSRTAYLLHYKDGNLAKSHASQFPRDDRRSVGDEGSVPFGWPRNTSQRR